jgi:transposase
VVTRTGYLAKDIAESTSYTRTWIGQIARRYNEQGPAGMVNRPHTTLWRAPRMLSVEQQEELQAALDGSKHWTCRAVADWRAAKLGRPMQVQRGWEYLQRLQDRKQSRQTPRPRHALADAELQAEFRKSYVLADSTAHEQGYTEQGGPPHRTGLLL